MIDSNFAGIDSEYVNTVAKGKNPIPNITEKTSALIDEWALAYKKFLAENK